MAAQGGESHFFDAVAGWRLEYLCDGWIGYLVLSINAARQPDGTAQAAIHLGEYRKMHPGPVEEFLFFDHPSGYDRIHSAMVWKGQNLQLFESPRQ